LPAEPNRKIATKELVLSKKIDEAGDSLLTQANANEFTKSAMYMQTHKDRKLPRRVCGT